MKGLCKVALAMLFVAACGRDGAITEPGAPNAAALPPGVLAIGVDSTTGASIETNKDDYSPGEVVHLVGRGWAPGETVNLHMTEEPNTHADVDTNVVADGAGGFSIHFYDVQLHDAGVTFTLTATGLTSNSVAVAVFTDGSLRVRTNSSLYVITVTWELFPAGNTTCAGTGVAGSTPNVNNGGSNEIVNIGATQSIKLTAPSSAGSPSQPFLGWTGFPAGQQTICVIGTNNTNHWDVNYNLVPTANAGGPYTGVEGTPFTLNGGASVDPENAITSYNWSIVPVTADPGATCSLTNGTTVTPSVTCNDDGTFSVQLTVTDNLGATSPQVTAGLTVSNVAPTATFGALPLSVSVGGAFTVSLTLPADAGSNDLGANLQYSFDCGAGGGYSVFGAASSLGCTGTITPTQTVKGRISDQDGGITEYTLGVGVTASNAPPSAEANGAYSGFTNTDVALSGAGSMDTDGTITQYAWTYTVTSSPDGGTCTFTNATSNLPNAAAIQCTQDGTYEVKLTVTDNGGATGEDVAVLTINNKAPTANAGGPYNNKPEGSSVTLTGSSSSDSDGSIVAYLWTYAVVSSDPGGDCQITNATSAVASIVCDDDGSFTVTLKVTDDDGATDEQTVALNVINANPVATITNGPYSGNEGSNISLTGTGNDPGDNDDAGLTYLWTIDYASVIDASGTCTITNANQPNASVKCTDDSNLGTFTVYLKVSDDDSGEHTTSVTLDVDNVAPTPTIDNTPPYAGAEGSDVSLSGSGDDQGDNDDAGLTYLWEVDFTGIDVGGSCTITNSTSPTLAKVKCTDDGSFTLKLTVSDDDAGSASTTVGLTITNANPVVTITSPTTASNLFSLLNGAVPVTATYTDQGSNDNGFECQLELVGDIGTVNSYVGVSGGNCSGSIQPVQADVYNLIVRVKDDDGGVGTASIMIVVYDPSAGFVTGGGWINSPAGAYIANTSLTGKANFGFVSKYKRGATVPDGNTEFQFHAGSLNFHSEVYEYLVVNQGGTNAQFKGTGTINGQGSYTFMLWASDNGNSGDTFRIKINNNNGGALVYDNLQPGPNPEQLIGGGQIVIHTGGKK